MGKDPQIKALAHTEAYYNNFGKGDGLEEDILE